jgi:poly(3-hydroxybutyrate) depolymerase
MTVFQTFTWTISTPPLTLTVNGVSPPATVTVSGGATVTVAVAGGPGQVGDWLGLFRVGATVSQWLDWKYLNGTRTRPATGLTAASVTFTLPSGSGNYEVRFFANDSATLLITSSTIVSSSSTQLTVNGVSPPATVTVAAGAILTVAVTGGPGQPGDWLGLYRVGATVSQWLDWKYLNGTRTRPSTGLQAATVTFTVPAGGGNYEIRFFENDTATLLVTSSTIISNVAPQVTVNGVSPPATVTVAGGAIVTVAVTGGPGEVGDWLGLYRVGATASQWLDWKYLNGTRTRPSTGLGAATVTFTLPVGGGNYEIRFFANDTATLLATSSTIISSTATQLTVNGVSPPATLSVSGGATVTVSVAGGPGQVGDWLGLYRVGATASQWLDWKYLNGTRTRPTTGLQAATVTFTLPAGSGNYEVRFYENDTTTLIATSSTIVASP